MAGKRLFGNGPNSILGFVKKLEKCFRQSPPLWFSFVSSMWTQSMWCYGRVGSHVSWCGNARPPRTFLLSFPPPSYYPTITAPTILLSLLLFIRTPLSCPQNGFACRPRLWQTKYKELWRLWLTFHQCSFHHFPLVKSIFHWAESHRASQLNSSVSGVAMPFLKLITRRLILFCLKDIIQD